MPASGLPLSRDWQPDRVTYKTVRPSVPVLFEFSEICQAAMIQTG